MGAGSNDALVRKVAAELPVRVGGGVRTVARAQELLDAGARAVIVGSALFTTTGGVDLDFARALADAVGVDHVIGAVDARGGQVAIHGWKTRLPLTAVEAVRALEPCCGGFLYTHVDREGLMQGTDLDAIRAVAAATSRRVTAAGGITTRAEIDQLDALGIDAVVGMAIYTGALDID
jgi:phosphoribosylformimino-5-aminoimidazole carboxamide ribotide isomerase